MTESGARTAEDRRAEDLRAAIDGFAARIDSVAPGSGPPLTVPVTLSPEAARALVDALRCYHDPRDHGAVVGLEPGFRRFMVDVVSNHKSNEDIGV